MAAGGYFPPRAAEWFPTFYMQQRRALHREAK
jgi:hypothetical protein